jgi:hypothetical protein
MKVGGREVCEFVRWIAMQTIRQIRFNDFAKLGILKEAPRQAIYQRGETADRGSEEDTFGSKETSRFK